MYPYDLFFGIDLYDIMFALALIASLLLVRILADRLSVKTKTLNLWIISAFVAMIGGLLSSVLFQAFYDYLETGVFEISESTGMTFYGGLIGGVVTFLVVCYGVGYFIDREHDNVKETRRALDIAACCITLSHAIGRIGCAFAGCCYGQKTDSWFGIYNVSLGYRTVPVQLMESAFIFLLFGVFLWRILHGKTYNLPLYLISYGVWRFFIEYLRDDDRGASFVSFLSPSQVTAIVLIIAGIILFAVLYSSESGKRRICKSADGAVSDEAK
ncbi:MAG: prolipoprotein diacylglyceryl transferase [Firmicutes bacterium]|nr:prolipoprotein diacylglyceryl transferase [Bacillota bacterium]